MYSTNQEYLFYDSERNIAFYDLDRISFYDIRNFQPPYYSDESQIHIPILRNIDQSWSGDVAGKAINLCENLNRVYNYYEQVLHIKSYDDNGGLIAAFVNDGDDNGKNAFCDGPMYHELVNGNYAVLRFGYKANFQNNLDVVGHEFTHAVQRALVHDLNYKNETGTLMEAYSDIAGELVVIVPEEAAVVRRIYAEYLDGASFHQIKLSLEADGILNGAGNSTWYASNIKLILTNEKYIGDALLQKTVTVNTLEKIRKKNNGVVTVPGTPYLVWCSAVIVEISIEGLLGITVEEKPLSGDASAEC